jgi:plasmid stability protein
MAQLIVRKLAENVKERLRRRALRNGRSLEEEAREILKRAVLAETTREAGAGTLIASHFRDLNIDFDIPELRGDPVRPARLPK